MKKRIKQIGARIDADLADKFKEYCDKKGLIQSRVIEILIERYLEENEYEERRNNDKIQKDSNS